MTITATPAKLRDGSWGARIAGKAPAVGTVVQIKTSSGKTWDAAVTAVVWQGPDAALVSTRSMDARPAGRRNDDVSLAERGLIRVNGPRGSYVRRMTRDEAYDEM